MENKEYLDELLVGSHMSEASRMNATITNLGWAQDEYGIASKTSKGLLESQIDPDTEKVSHRWGRL